MPSQHQPQPSPGPRTPARPRVVISLDSSTTACKAIAWDQAGHARAEGRATYPLLQPLPGWHEQRADDWWAGACHALRACLAQLGPAQVEALAITHQRESFVPVDRDGSPERHAILWSDERSRGEVLELARRYGPALAQLTGKPPSMTASIAKLLWLARHEPQTARGAYKLLDVHAFLVLRLTGEWRTSLASADPLGIVDMAHRCWADDLIRELGYDPGQFVELVAPGAPIGCVSTAGAAASGLPAGLPVFAGAGDGQCAGLGCGVTFPGRAYLNLGTGIASGAWCADYVCDPAFRTLYAPGPGHCAEHILRGGVYTVAWFIDKFAADLRAAQQAGGPSAESVLEAAAADLPPGADGLMLVPYWNTVMSPYWDPLASGVMIGWTGAHGREHFYRAILEGIAFEQRLVGDGMMAAVGQRFGEYIATGGGARSPLWLQICADVTGIPVAPAETPEATCLGAGILAAVGAGWHADVPTAAAAMTRHGAPVWPDPAAQAQYDRLYTDVYQGLYPQLRTALTNLSTLTHPSPARPAPAGPASAGPASGSPGRPRGNRSPGSKGNQP